LVIFLEIERLARFEVINAVPLTIKFFRDVTPTGWCERFQQFGRKLALISCTDILRNFMNYSPNDTSTNPIRYKT
jgi:hypothetical protein